MSLEKDIHQREFRSEYHKTILNILFTHNHLVSKMTDVFKTFDITRQQYNVLRILRGQFPHHCSVNLIRDRMLDKMSDASRLVSRLKAKGLILRQHGKDDKRSVEITISPAGLELLKRMEGPVTELDNITGTLTLQEARELNRLLDKLREKKNPGHKGTPPGMELVSEHEKF